MCKGVEQFRILKCSSLLPWRCLVRCAGQLPPHCGTLPSGSYWQASPHGPDQQLHSWRQKVQQMFFKPAVSGEKSYILTEVEPFH